ncbi:MAG: PDZ domain-containing protein [Methanophagales archaeon ANME-1-THS]|nr:MAG: PDZ domain-containing protein [Methanophagales archaeon ANME-1-THS]
MAGESQPRSRWLYVSIVLIVILITQTGVFLYALIDFQREIEELQTEQESDFASLTRSIDRLRSDLDQLQQLNGLVPSSGVTPVLIYDLSKDSVVLITAKQQQTFGGLVPVSSGSGFVYDQEGHIVTNNHVVEDADAIEVTFPDGTIAQAVLVGTDPYSDLAVIRVDSPSELLYPLPLGRSSDLLVGESVMAIGNPFGLSNSMSLGIVSQLGRDLDAPGNYKIVDVIQVDAAINPGNSGGPLMNMHGEVVGVNTAIIQGSVGVGFAIPSDTVSREVTQLIQTGRYLHPWIGISSVDLDPDIAGAMGLSFTKGTLVVDVVAGSPAEVAGIKAGTRPVTISGRTFRIGGDIIVGVDGITVRKLTDMIVYIERTKKPGDTVTFTIIRASEPLNVDLTLGVRPQP